MRRQPAIVLSAWPDNDDLPSLFRNASKFRQPSLATRFLVGGKSRTRDDQVDSAIWQWQCLEACLHWCNTFRRGVLLTFSIQYAQKPRRWFGSVNQLRAVAQALERRSSRTCARVERYLAAKIRLQLAEDLGMQAFALS